MHVCVCECVCVYACVILCVQDKLCKLFGGKLMTQQSRVSFLVGALQLKAEALVRTAAAVVAQCWLQTRQPYSEHDVVEFATQMLHDLHHVPQGEKQKFSQGGDEALHLATLWCIFSDKSAVEVPSSFGK